MKNKLKVGQQFEVVEVLTDGEYPYGVFNIGGYTLHFKEYSSGGGKTLCNGVLSLDYFYYEKHGCICLHMIGADVKPVGRLTVTKIK